MAILEAEPIGWASSGVLIKSDGLPVTELEITVWKSRGRFQLDGQDFEIEPKGFWLHNAELKKGPSVIAKAKREAAAAGG